MQKDYNYHKLNYHELPDRLKTIDSPPKQLFYRGEDIRKLSLLPSVAIVGSRKPTNYGRQVTTNIAGQLAERGVVVISGLALGIDSIAHQAVVDKNGTTIAVLACGPYTVYPASHRNLAIKILQSGGSLVTEYPPNTAALKSNFIARNRLISALSDIVIITEAAEKSGTLHTANFALSQGRTVMAVPGPITSAYSKGPNNLIKAGALPLTDVTDVLFKLGINESKKTSINASNQPEYIILTLLSQGITDGHELLNASNLEVQLFNQTLTMLEINSQITPLGNNHWSLS